MSDSMCGCEDVDPYCCFASRHNLGIASFEVVEACGGPCECHCHWDEFDDVEELDFSIGKLQDVLKDALDDLDEEESCCHPGEEE